MEYRYVLILGPTQARIEVIYALGQLVFLIGGLVQSFKYRRVPPPV